MIAAKAEASSLRHRQALRVVNQALRNGIQFFQGSIFHAAEMRHPQTMLLRQVAAKLFRVNFHGAQATQHAKAQKLPDGASRHRLG